MKTIKFYRVNEPYGEFSNFFPSKIVISNFVWPTVEHFFQASKFDDYRIQDKIRECSTPMDAAKEGRDRNNPLRDDWEQVKEKFMHKALTAKFLQIPSLKRVLLCTYDAMLVEHTSNDAYWADGEDGNGKNRLGILLMEVRDQIKTISPNPDLILPPWISFPSTDPRDLFWRMGIGEVYLDTWRNYRRLHGLKEYESAFPETEEWKGSY